MIEFDLTNGERIKIEGTGLAEPTKMLIIERALVIAAKENRSEAPEAIDFERAAKELSSDARLMKKGEANELDEPEDREPSGAS